MSAEKDNLFIGRTYEGSTIQEGKLVPYAKSYKFRQAKYQEVLSLNYMLIADKVTPELWQKFNLSLRVLCVKDSNEGKDFTESYFANMPAHEAAWLDRVMAEVGCVDLPFGNLLGDAYSIITEAEKIQSLPSSAGYGP